MKLIVFGASGKTGLKIVQKAQQAGHEVTAFVREPSKAKTEAALGAEAKEIRFFTGDVLNAGQVEEAIADQDAAICALGSMSLGKTEVRSQGTANIIAGMQVHGVTRLIAISAMGVGESWSTLSFINKAFFATLLFSTRADHEAQEAAVKKSNLDWTLFRPSGLTEDPATGNFKIGEMIAAGSSKISRADLAGAIVHELEEGRFIQKAPTITN